MIVKAVHRVTHQTATYKDVVKVKPIFDENRSFCQRLYMSDGTAATFHTSEWALFELSEPGNPPKWKMIFLKGATRE